jgi:hypothetical protein
MKLTNLDVVDIQILSESLQTYLDKQKDHLAQLSHDAEFGGMYDPEDFQIPRTARLLAALETISLTKTMSAAG